MATVFTKFTSQSDKLGQSGNGISSTLICGLVALMTSQAQNTVANIHSVVNWNSTIYIWLGYKMKRGWEKLMGKHVTTTKYTFGFEGGKSRTSSAHIKRSFEDLFHPQ